jgi:hypothetical protein
MVNTGIHNLMQAHIRNNWQEDVKNHPEEYVLLENINNQIQETFYPSKSELEKTVLKYKGMFGPTFIAQHISSQSHKYNPENLNTFFSTDKHLEICPNDNKTKLTGSGAIIYNSTATPGTEYTEEARCPDCNCIVFRRPTEKAIAKSQKRLNETFFN